MRMYSQKRFQSHRGFSILELLLVLAILGILAGVVAVKFTGQSQKARVTATRLDIGTFTTAIDMFEGDMGRFPTTSEGLKALVEKPADDNGTWKGYLKGPKTIKLDQWGNEWQYRCPGQHNEDEYDLWSNGPDGREGSEDDITNW